MNNPLRQPHRALIAATLGLLTITSAAQAVLTTPLWARPADDVAAAANRSTVQIFDVFSDDVTATAGVQDLTPEYVVNPNGIASVSDTGGGFTTSTGNLYSPTSILKLAIDVPGYAPIPAASTRFLLQIDTLGGELVRTSSTPTPTYDFSAFKINGTAISTLGGFSYTELARVASMGASVSHAFTFTLPTTATSYSITYSPLGTSSSQAQIAVESFVNIAGDFDYDGDRDVDDVNLLLHTTGGATTPGRESDRFDVNRDNSVVNLANAAASDLDVWVRTLEQTAYGDADLNKKVNFDDLLILARNYNQPSDTWAKGDFDGSGTVSFDDLLALARNYGFGTGTGTATGALSAEAFAEDWAAAQALVPEPATISALAALGLITGRRRRATTHS